MISAQIILTLITYFVVWDVKKLAQVILVHQRAIKVDDKKGMRTTDPHLISQWITAGTAPWKHFLNHLTYRLLELVLNKAKSR